MNAIQLFENASKRLGYRTNAIQRNYEFNDFASDDARVRRAELAIFTQTPASYRSAAFGVASANATDAERIVGEHRALGAPIYFVVENNHVSVWQVFGTGPARFLERTALDSLDALFVRHQAQWSPDAIHRAKSIGKFDKAYQLDFVDIGLLPAIEGQIHHKLDRLLSQVLAAIKPSKSSSLDERGMFQAIFRLLAAKILVDRKHEAAKQWNLDDAGSMLAGIGAYYNLSGEARFANAVNAKQFTSAWAVLRDGINVSNISADDLAYVYENTLVTPETRQLFGTHSTPRQVADFIAARLRLWHPSASSLRIYEPCAGAGVLLVAALRHMRESLPMDWSDHKRHQHLVKQIRGSEIDAFACEVATLSLILADYPNTNGWKIDNTDLFREGRLAAELAHADVVLCNPPFEALSDTDRRDYPDIVKVGGTKAEAVLKMAISASPQALGFVLPRAALLDRAYAWHRAEIEKRYADIELVSLPDRIFAESKVESALLIARNPITAGQQHIRSSEVDDQDRKRFLSLGVPSRVREETRVMNPKATGALWLPKLHSLWRRIDELPKLSQFVEGHWGLRWLDGRQSTAGSIRPAAYREKGVLRSHDHRQFMLGQTFWLDVRPEHLYGGGNLPWDRPKILCNAGRSSRGKWRISAAVDRDGLMASQQFVALWPIAQDVDLDAISAVINGPLANAYMTEHSTDKRLRITTLLNLPIPLILPPELGELAREYAVQVSEGRSILGGERVLQRLLDQMDSLVLEAYDLPPRLVRDLLAEFREAKRPIAHFWEDWDVSSSDPAFTLSELRSTWVQKSRGNWPSRELLILPAAEGQLIAKVMG